MGYVLNNTICNREFQLYFWEIMIVRMTRNTNTFTVRPVAAIKSIQTIF